MLRLSPFRAVEGVRHIVADSAVPAVPRDLVQHGTIPFAPDLELPHVRARRRSRSARVLPLGFTRQAERRPRRHLPQPGDEFLRVFPVHPLHGSIRALESTRVAAHHPRPECLRHRRLSQPEAPAQGDPPPWSFVAPPARFVRRRSLEERAGGNPTEARRDALDLKNGEVTARIATRLRGPFRRLVRFETLLLEIGRDREGTSAGNRAPAGFRGIDLEGRPGFVGPLVVAGHANARVHAPDRRDAAPRPDHDAGRPLVPRHELELGPDLPDVERALAARRRIDRLQQRRIDRPRQRGARVVAMGARPDRGQVGAERGVRVRGIGDPVRRSTHVVHHSLEGAPIGAARAELVVERARELRRLRDFVRGRPDDAERVHRHHLEQPELARQGRVPTPHASDRALDERGVVRLLLQQPRAERSDPRRIEGGAAERRAEHARVVPRVDLGPLVRRLGPKPMAQLAQQARLDAQQDRGEREQALGRIRRVRGSGAAAPEPTEPLPRQRAPDAGDGGAPARGWHRQQRAERVTGARQSTPQIEPRRADSDVRVVAEVAEHDHRRPVLRAREDPFEVIGRRLVLPPADMQPVAATLGRDALEHVVLVAPERHEPRAPVEEDDELARPREALPPGDAPDDPAARHVAHERNDVDRGAVARVAQRGLHRGTQPRPRRERPAPRRCAARREVGQPEPLGSPRGLDPGSRRDRPERHDADERDAQGRDLRVEASLELVDHALRGGGRGAGRRPRLRAGRAVLEERRGRAQARLVEEDQCAKEVGSAGARAHRARSGGCFWNV